MSRSPKGRCWRRCRKGRRRTRRATTAKRALARRDLVLALMRREGYLDDIGLVAARAEPLRIAAERMASAAAGRFATRSTPCASLVDSVTSSRSRRTSTDYVVYTTLDLERAARRRTARSAARGGDPAGSAVLGGAQRRDDRGRDGRDRSAHRRHPRARRRTAVRARQLQSRARGASPAGLGVQAVRLCGGARRRAITPASHVDDEPVEVDQGGRSGRRRTTATSTSAA